MEKMIQIGVIGLQGFGFTYFQTLENCKIAKITAVCDVNEEVAQPICEKYGVEHYYKDYCKMLENKELDAVFIATPHFLHYKMTMDALRKGKHVLCEKPLAITPDEAHAMASLAEEKGLLLSCNFNRRQTEQVKWIHDVIRQQKLGEIYSMKLKWMARYTGFMFSQNSGWRIEKKKAGGGILIGRGSHMLDAALYLMEYPEIVSVRANINSKLSGFEVDDYAFLCLGLKSGALITIECSYLANLPQYANHIEYEVLGTKAGIYCSETDGKAVSHMGHGMYPDGDWVDLSAECNLEEFKDTYPTSIVEDFVQAVHDGRKPLVTGEQAALVTDILEQAYRSSEEKKELPFKMGGI